MTADRRHELQQNELAAYLDRIGKVLEPYSRILIVGLGVIAFGAIALSIYRSQQSGQRSDATFELIQAIGSSDSEVLLEVGENYAGTTAGSWSRLFQGQMQLSEGIAALYTNRSTAEELLENSQVAFRAAMSSSNDPLLQSRGHFGLARAAESLGNLDEAIEEYEQVIVQNESEGIVEKAEERIAALKDPETREFIAWFADQDFAPADPSLPPFLQSDELLPSDPDMDFPDFPGVLKMGESGTIGEEGLALPADAGTSETVETDDAEETVIELPETEVADEAEAVSAEDAE